MSSIDDLPILPEKAERFVFTQHLGLVIGLVALIVSIVSASQSFRTATLQKELTRPRLDARFALLANGGRKPVFRLDYRGDTGHHCAFVTVTMVSQKFEYGTIRRRECACKILITSKENGLAIRRRRSHPAILSGSRWLFRCRRGCSKFTVWIVNGTS